MSTGSRRSGALSASAIPYGILVEVESGGAEGQVEVDENRPAAIRWEISWAKLWARVEAPTPPRAAKGNLTAHEQGGGIGVEAGDP